MRSQYQILSKSFKVSEMKYPDGQTRAPITHLVLRRTHTNRNYMCEICAGSLLKPPITYCSFQHVDWPNIAFDCLALLLRIQEDPGSNHGPETGYPDWGVSWFSSFPPWKFWDSGPTWIRPRQFPSISRSLFINHPSLDASIVSTESVVK
jgi:hypothetical protein